MNELKQLHERCRVLRWCLLPLAIVLGPWIGGAAAQSEPDLTVTGILLGPTRVAIIRAGDYTFISKVGEPVGDAVVAAIFPGKVVLKRGETTFELPAQPTGLTPLRATLSRAAAGPVQPVQPSRALPVRTVQPARRPVVVPQGSSPGSPVAPAPRTRRDASPGGDMTVTGILVGARRLAILQTKEGESFVAGAGDPIGDAVVVAVLPQKVILRRAGVLFELPLGSTVL